MPHKTSQRSVTSSTLRPHDDRSRTRTRGTTQMPQLDWVWNPQFMVALQRTRKQYLEHTGNGRKVLNVCGQETAEVKLQNESVLQMGQIYKGWSPRGAPWGSPRPPSSPPPETALPRAPEKEHRPKMSAATAAWDNVIIRKT